MLAISQKLLSAASTDETAVATPQAFAYTGCKRCVHHVAWGTGVSAGVVCIETADDPDYTGTWTTLATVTFAGTAPKSDVVTTEGPYVAYRHRIDTAVADGTVTTRIQGEC